ncbi:MAG: hypothetical protein ACI9Y1_002773, partial [Lentisphaeria bacterium]
CACFIGAGLGGLFGGVLACIETLSCPFGYTYSRSCINLCLTLTSGFI